MSNVAGIGTTRQAMTSLLRVRKGDQASAWDLSRVADYRVVNSGKGALVPVSITQAAVVRALPQITPASLFEERTGFWQSRFAGSRAYNVGLETVKALLRRHNVPPLALLGQLLEISVNGQHYIAVKQRLMIRRDPEAGRLINTIRASNQRLIDSIESQLGLEPTEQADWVDAEMHVGIMAVQQLTRDHECHLPDFTFIAEARKSGILDDLLAEGKEILISGQPPFTTYGYFAYRADGTCYKIAEGQIAPEYGLFVYAASVLGVEEKE